VQEQQSQTAKSERLRWVRWTEVDDVVHTHVFFLSEQMFVLYCVLRVRVCVRACVRVFVSFLFGTCPQHTLPHLVGRNFGGG